MYKSIINNRTHRTLVAEAHLAKTVLRDLLYIQKVLKPFDGQKIVKMDGYWTKAFETAIKPIRRDRANLETVDFKTYHERTVISKSYKSVSIEVKADFVWQQFDEEYKCDDRSMNSKLFYIGKLEDDNTLTLNTDMIENTTETIKHLINLDWDYIELQLKRREELLNQVKELESTVPYYSYR